MEADRYEKFKIKTYDFWGLYLHENQFPYLGRCYAWALRPDANDVMTMSEPERDELFDIVIPKWDDAIKQLFNHDKVNVAFLGNTTPHLHAHLIPRYETPREFSGVTFTDPNPSGNYAPYPKRELPPETLMTIKKNITSLL